MGYSSKQPSLYVSYLIDTVLSVCQQVNADTGDASLHLFLFAVVSEWCINTYFTRISKVALCLMNGWIIDAPHVEVRRAHPLLSSPPSARDRAADISSAVNPYRWKGGHERHDGWGIRSCLLTIECRLHASLPCTIKALSMCSKLLLLHIERLSNLVLEEADSLREWSGLRLGMDQKVYAIHDLVFPHRGVVCG